MSAMGAQMEISIKAKINPTLRNKANIWHSSIPTLKCIAELRLNWRCKTTSRLARPQFIKWCLLSQSLGFMGVHARENVTHGLMQTEFRKTSVDCSGI